jgi:hypothetical protein
MPRRVARQLYHPPYAEQARRAPGTWLRVRAYELPAAAAFVATAVRTGSYPCYRPAGAFLADIRRTTDGYALWISYQPPEAT